MYRSDFSGSIWGTIVEWCRPEGNALVLELSFSSPNWFPTAFLGLILPTVFLSYILIYQWALPKVILMVSRDALKSTRYGYLVLRATKQLFYMMITRLYHMALQHVYLEHVQLCNSKSVFKVNFEMYCTCWFYAKTGLILVQKWTSRFELI